MNGRGAFFSEELLSGYLDGELSDEHRREVEQQLDSDPGMLEKCQALTALGDHLRMLKRYRLSEEAASRLSSAVEAARVDCEWQRPGAPDEAELISAYVDGELTGSEREAVQSGLERDEPLRRLFDRLAALQRRLAHLPVYRLDDGFAARVMRQIKSLSSDASVGSGEPSGELVQVAVASRKESPSQAVTWRGAFWALAAIATAILLVVFAPRGGEPPGQPVAGNGTVTPPPHVLDVPVDTPPIRPEGPIPGTPASPLTLVSSLSKVQLVLVYEVLVTEEGVRHAAFPNLLLRHGIGFAQTSAISRKDQEDLLQHRFLQNVQIADQQRTEMDRVDLYLVRTTALTADAVYADLMSRPVGIGSFSLNLTTRGAESRVLHRLCQSTELENQVDQAVQLLANFGIFSSAARNLGVFGTVGWIDPALYEIPSPAPEPLPQDPGRKHPMAPPEAADGFEIQPPSAPLDFQCELLFVVRQAGIRPDPPNPQ
jgi:anti-sigma factor RsiW